MSEGSVELREAIPKVKSFKTAHGSVYTYDADGKTTRFQTATNTQHKRQDITIFIDLDPNEERKILNGYHHPTPNHSDEKVYVLERQEDDKGRIIRDISEVKDHDRVYIGIMKNGQITFTKKASVTPVIGYQVFDHRHYEEDGEWYSDRHLGNQVVEVEYEK